MKRVPNTKILSLLFVTLTVLILTACTGSSTVEPVVESKTSVHFQMAWVHEFSTAGYYAAEKNGHFAEQGLDVTLTEGGFGAEGRIEAIDRLESGEADFISTSSAGLFRARAKGLPVVAIAATLQHNPLVLMSPAEKNIIRPLDLQGKRVAISGDGATAMFETLLSGQGIDLTEIEIIPRTTYGIEPLLNDEADVLFGWVVNEGVLMQEAGLEPNFILPSDYGVEIYDPLVITTEDMIAKQPDVVESFLRALIQGHQDIIDDPEQAIDLTLSYDDSLIREEQLRRLKMMIPLVKPPGSLIGDMNPEIWDTSHQMLLKHGILSEAADVDAVYTLSFIENIYTE